MKLGPRGWWDLLEAQVWVLRAQWLLRSRPVGALVHPGRGTAPGGGIEGAGPRLEEGLLPRAEAIALAVGRISRVGLARPLCLARSLALHHMLEHRGIAGSEVRVGVKGGRGDLEAHAWVEWHGHVLGDLPENVGTFLPMDALVVEGGRVHRDDGGGELKIRTAGR